MNQSYLILRELTKEYVDLANNPCNDERRKLHRAVNDLEMIRPVVLLNEIPWVEMNIDNQLTTVNEDPFLKNLEYNLRKKIFQFKYFPADMYLTPYIGIQKVVEESDIGISVSENTIETGDGNNIKAHEYFDMLKTEEDLEKLHNPVIKYNKEETFRRYQLVGDIIGDIIPLRIQGKGYFSCGTWDDISYLRGVTPLLMDLIDRPEFTHKMVRKFTDIYKYRLDTYESMGLFDTDPQTLHSTPVLNSTLKPLSDKEHVTRKNIWGRGVAQILASASKDMRDEFDIEYMKETVGQCGLVYYGCCEPLDTMIDIVEKIPNIRKIGVTPWANVDVATDAIGDRYVVSSKPNPASVAVDSLDENELRKELGKILKASKRNNCHIDIVLKDISSCKYHPENIFKWEQIAMEMVNDY